MVIDCSRGSAYDGRAPLPEHAVPLTAGAAVVALPSAGLSAGAYPVHVGYSGNPTYAPYAADHQDLTVR